ncbi:unnamed protein product, partial [Ectocarpus sp. 4 AP-2014]
CATGSPPPQNLTISRYFFKAALSRWRPTWRKCSGVSRFHAGRGKTQRWGSSIYETCSTTRTTSSTARSRYPTRNSTRRSGLTAA